MAGCYLIALSTSLVFLAWLFSWDGRSYGPPYISHDGALYFNHDYLHTVQSKEQIVELVKHAYDKKMKVRVLGSGHSWSPIATSDGILISMYHYRGLVSRDLAKKQVTVRGGTTLVEISALLDEQGWALSNLPSVSDQTIAGAIVTATHGTGISFGNLATFVTSFEFVTGTGEIVKASPVEPSDVFYAGLISIGLFGIITEVTLQCEDAFNLHEVLEPLQSIEQCLNEMPTVLKKSEHVKYWIVHHSDTCSIFSANRTSEKPRNNAIRSIRNFSMCIFEFFQWMMSVIPTVTPNAMWALVNSGVVFPAHSRVDHNIDVFNIPYRVGGHPEAEIGIDIKNCAEGVRTLLQFISDEKIPVNHIIEVRFVKSDNIWLSPNYKRDSCHITQLLYTPSEEIKQKYFFGFHRMMERFSGRPHWAKEFNVTIDQLKKSYPQFDNFLAMRQRMDPAGIFVNRFLNQQFQLDY